MFTDEQIERYSRQILLQGVGGTGQRRLLESKVLIVGAGALGSVAGLCLAGAGVGHLGVLDSDVVDVSNLHRQLAHTTGDLGRRKAESAADALRRRNPDVDVQPFCRRFTADTAEETLGLGWDFVVDATDNFDSKFLIAAACHLARVPYAHAGVLRFQGQALTVLPGESACYRCLFREPPPPESVPTCAQAGILGTVPAILGAVQATEAIKCLLNLGDLLTNRLFTIDVLTMKSRLVPFRRRADCGLCGTATAL